MTFIFINKGMKTLLLVFICFEMTTTTKGLSASQVARRYEISRQTAHYFMQKVREAMKSSESHKMNDLGFQSLI